MMSQKRKIAAILLAAGESRRFGSLKQLVEWQGTPLVRFVAARISAMGFKQVIVVVPAQHPEVENTLGGLALDIIHNYKTDEGMSRSLKLGVQGLLPSIDAAVIFLVDQPRVDKKLVSALVNQYEQTTAQLVAPEAGGRRGNPVLIDRSLFADLESIRGDQGARGLFGSAKVSLVQWNDESNFADIDTQEEYQRMTQSAHRQTTSTVSNYQLTLNNRGDYQAQSLAGSATLDELTLKSPESAYTTMRTFGRQKVIRLHEHFDRIRETFELRSSELTLNETNLRAQLRVILDEHYQADGTDAEYRIRIAVPFHENGTRIYISLEKLHTPTQEQYANGVYVKNVIHHRENPKAKAATFIETAEQIRSRFDAGIYEALMVLETGEILEGLSSNFFVFCGGILHTAEEGVLSGITRQIVLEAARSLALEVCLQPASILKVNEFQECFITSTSRGILPVVKIDDHIIGSGKPGEMTRRLMTRYVETQASQAEAI